MVKKVLTATAVVALFSTPSLAVPIGRLTSTNTVTTTGGTRQLTITGNYSSTEYSVTSSTTGTGATASASVSNLTPTLATSGANGGVGNSASATYSTNAITNGSYTNDVRSSFSGVETTTFNY